MASVFLGAGRLFDAAFSCGSFADMSSVARLKNEGEAAVAGLFCGLAFILAFGSVLA
jgi:hypothetical protein